MLNYLPKLYLDCFKHACARFVSSIEIVLGCFALAFGWLLLASKIAGFGMAGGIALALLKSAAIAFYLGWLRDADANRRFSFRDLRHFDTGLFGALISVFFLLWVGQLLIGMFAFGSSQGMLLPLFWLSVFILLNALPETLYLTRREGMDAFNTALQFLQRNWIEWFVANVGLLLLVWGVLDYVILPGVVLATDSVIITLSLVAILQAAALHWIMLFRAKLYRELETGSRRQRMFKARAG